MLERNGVQRDEVTVPLQQNSNMVPKAISWNSTSDIFSCLLVRQEEPGSQAVLSYSFSLVLCLMYSDKPCAVLDVK